VVEVLGWLNLTLPVEAFQTRAMLSILPVMKKTPSGDHAKSYISDPMDLHICLSLHVSLSSSSSSPNAVAGFVPPSDGTQRITVPSSPADASISPIEDS